MQGLSRSTAAAIELLGSAFEGIVVSDRFSAYNHLPVEQRQLCWAHLIRDLSAIAERQGVSGEIGLELLALQQQLFVQWHQWKDGAIDWPTLQLSCRPLRQHFEGTLQRVVDLGFAPKERTPWAQTVRTCQQLLLRKEALWTFLEIHGIEPTNNAAERALRQSVIQHKIRDMPSNSHGVQSASVLSAVAACSRSPPPCANRSGIFGSSWSRPGSPITGAGSGLIQSVSQGPWPERSAFRSLSRLAPSLCPKPALLQPISI